MTGEPVLDTKYRTGGDMAKRATYREQIEKLEKETTELEIRFHTLKADYSRNLAAFREKHGVHSWDLYDGETTPEQSKEIAALSSMDIELERLEVDLDSTCHRLHRLQHADKNRAPNSNVTHANDLWQSICTHLEMLLDDRENMVIRDAVMSHLKHLSEWIREGGIAPNIRAYQYAD